MSGDTGTFDGLPYFRLRVELPLCVSIAEASYSHATISKEEYCLRLVTSSLPQADYALHVKWDKEVDQARVKCRFIRHHHLLQVLAPIVSETIAPADLRGPL